MISREDLDFDFDVYNHGYENLEEFFMVYDFFASGAVEYLQRSQSTMVVGGITITAQKDTYPSPLSRFHYLSGVAEKVILTGVLPNTPCLSKCKIEECPNAEVYVSEEMYGRVEECGLCGISRKPDTCDHKSGDPDQHMCAGCNCWKRDCEAVRQDGGTTWKIIGTSNFNIETDSDFLQKDGILDEEEGKTAVKNLNEAAGEGSHTFFKLVPWDYKLYDWEP